MTLTLLVDLYDINQKLIAKKGTAINFEFVHKVMLHGRKYKKTFIPFSDTELFKNFKNIFNEEKYFTIFTPYRINDEITNIAREVKLTKEIIEELRIIKENLPYTFRHILIVTALTIKISLDLKDKGCDPHYAAIIGLTHDLGKSRIPKTILGKDTPLTQEEYDLLKTHPVLSYLLLCYYVGDSLDGIPNALRDHHEKLDGSGYPRGIAKLDKYTRLLTPVDIFDALVSERPYRGSSFTIRQALDYLIDESNAGKIDKEVVYYLISYVRKEHPQPHELEPYSKKTSLSRSDSTYGKIIPNT